MQNKITTDSSLLKKEKNSTSGVSIAIKNTITSLQSNKPLINTVKPSEFSVKVANTLEEREEVFHLAYNVYLAKGFVKKNANELLINPYDADPDTLILMVKDSNNKIIASVSLVFDGLSKLPAEKIYSDELKVLKRKNEKIAEISRLVIDPNYRNSKEILVLLFNYLYIYTDYIKQYTCLAIEVNPKHIAYYKALLNFKEIGSEKLCPIVQSAPAILLYLSLSEGKKEVSRILNLPDKDQKSRSLFKYFIAPEQEKLVAYYLEKQAKPMSMEEKLYFGFSCTDLNLEVCV